MNLGLKLLVVGISLWILVLSVYVLITVPLNGLADYIPRPTALARYDSQTESASSLTQAVVRRSFKAVRLTPAQVNQLERELMDQGFEEFGSTTEPIYCKTQGGLMPVTSSVSVGPTGEVVCSAVRTKW